MAIVRFQSTVWDTPARQDLFRYVGAELMLNVPARYRIGPGPGQEWTVFSDTRLTLDQVADIGALAAFDLDDLPGGWQLPDNPETADRDAAAKSIHALVSVVEPADIEYQETVIIQVFDRELVTRIDPETGEEHTFWVTLDTTHPVAVEQTVANVWQTTLDANNAPGHTKAESAPDPAWRPLEVI